jgi:hypothetical protein
VLRNFSDTIQLTAVFIATATKTCSSNCIQYFIQRVAIIPFGIKLIVYYKLQVGNKERNMGASGYVETAAVRQVSEHSLREKDIIADLDPPARTARTASTPTSTPTPTAAQQGGVMRGLWNALSCGGGLDHLLVSCQEGLCHHLQDPCDNDNGNACVDGDQKGGACNTNVFDPYNFTIAHNDSMSTNATGEIDPDKVFAEHYNLVIDPVETLEKMRMDSVRETAAMGDDSSISSIGGSGGSGGGRRRNHSLDTPTEATTTETKTTTPTTDAPPSEIIATSP